MLFVYIGVFVASCALLAIAGDWLVKALNRIARFLGWKEFVISFFLMSFATSLPELFVGISSAVRGIPELSFGNIIGQNIVHFTLSVGICLLFIKELHVESKTVQTSAVFTFFASLLPLVLVFDGSLSRGDGIALILLFLLYAGWLFSKKEYFSMTYGHAGAHTESDHENGNSVGHISGVITRARQLFRDFGLFLAGGVLLVAAAFGIVRSSEFFAGFFAFPIVLVGVLIVSIGTALPETYFSVAAARRGKGWMLVGNLLGATAVSSSLVLGIVAIIRPIVIADPSPFFINRIFLFASAIFFLLFLRTGRKIGKVEGVLLLALYVLFVIFESVYSF
jgi:cation:H+ antiporter